MTTTPGNGTWREVRRCHAADAHAIVERLTAAGIPAIVPSPQTMGTQPMCRPRGDDVRVLVPEVHFLHSQAELTSRAEAASRGSRSRSPPTTGSD